MDILLKLYNYEFYQLQEMVGLSAICFQSTALFSVIILPYDITASSKKDFREFSIIKWVLVACLKKNLESGRINFESEFYHLPFEKLWTSYFDLLPKPAVICTFGSVYGKSWELVRVI